jgi:hypothetical protein
MIHLPTAGKAIGVLGAAGVIVALGAEKLPAGHKFLWAVITLLLLVIEVRAIDNDRREQNDTHLAELKRQDDEHAATIHTIIEVNRTQSEQNQTHFDKTLGEMKGLAASGRKAISLSTEAIGQITGEDSWIEIIPERAGGEPFSSFFVTVHGRYPFYGESVEVYDSSAFHHRRPSFPPPAPESLIAVGKLRTYYPGLAYPLPLAVPITAERAQMFEFRIIGRAGFIQQWVKLSRSGGDWRTSLEVHRGKKLLATWTDPNFPKNWKLEPPPEPLDPKLNRNHEE